MAAGTWINVIGYTLALPRLTRTRNMSSARDGGQQAALLQAVLIWDAGAVRAGEYENTLSEQRCVQEQLLAAHD